MDDLAARRALISAGVVGLGTLALTNMADVKLKYSLPVSFAGALALDYMVNSNEIEQQIQITNQALRESITAEGFFHPSGPAFQTALFGGLTALMAGGTMIYGKLYRQPGNALAAPGPGNALAAPGPGTALANIVQTGAAAAVQGWQVTTVNRLAGMAFESMGRMYARLMRSEDPDLQTMANTFNNMDAAQRNTVEDLLRDEFTIPERGPHIIIRDGPPPPPLSSDAEELVLLENESGGRVAISLPTVPPEAPSTPVRVRVAPLIQVTPQTLRRVSDSLVPTFQLETPERADRHTIARALMREMLDGELRSIVTDIAAEDATSSHETTDAMSLSNDADTLAFHDLSSSDAMSEAEPEGGGGLRGQALQQRFEEILKDMGL